MKKILLLSTGGTIASKETTHGFVPQMSGELLISMIPQLSGLCNIDCKEIMNIDSSNMQPEDWQLIAKAVYECIDEYDGFVITHGTDTMAYSAAALSLMLVNLHKPVIFTGSQIAMSIEGSDGIKNLYDAFLAAMEKLQGVYVVFAGKIIKGNCAKKLYTKNLNAFESINEKLAGTIEAGIVKLDENIKFSQDLEDLVENKPAALLDTRLNKNVALIKLVPGMDCRILEAVIDMGYEGIVIEAFGSGGIPNLTNSLVPVIEKACSKNIVVVIATQCVYDGTNLSVYDVGVSASKAGARTAANATTEAAVVQLMWELGHR